MECGTFSTRKKVTFRRRILLTFAEFKIGRIMDFYLENGVKFVCLSNPKNIFPDPIMNFQISYYNITINTSIFCDTDFF